MKRLIRVVHRAARGTQTTPTFHVRRIYSSYVGVVTVRVLLRARSVSATVQAVAAVASHSARCSLSSASY